MSKKELNLGNKSFLNETGHHSIAFIGYNIRLEKEFLGDRLYPYGSMWFGDCSRVITLDLEMSQKGAYKNSKQKLETIIKVCEQALEDLETANETYLEHKRKLKKKKKKKTKKKK